jgi:hypothetical protein
VGYRIIASANRIACSCGARTASGWLFFELQRVKFERSLQIPILGSNELGFLHLDLKGLEQSPVLNVVPVL